MSVVASRLDLDVLSMFPDMGNQTDILSWCTLSNAFGCYPCAGFTARPQVAL